MIFIRLTGGLGNQLFQYAFARSLSYNLDTELFLDISIYSHEKRPKHTIFALNSYNIKGIVGNYPYVDKTAVGINYEEKQDLAYYVEGVPFPDSIYEYGLIDDSYDFQIPAYFRGWYHNQIKDRKTSYITENFFKINNKLIHEDLNYSVPLSDNSQKLIEDIEKFDSIALHIRHGDYKNFPKFGFCTPEYYQNAIEFISEHLDNPKFYVFTEDPDWVDENLKIDFPYEIIRFSEKNNTTARGYAELLKLMSSCDYFILANSTFSWWGAFLSENENKVIISPKPWFQDRSIIKSDTIDNVKTISLKNDYYYLFENSKRILFEMTYENTDFENIIPIESKIIPINIDAKISLNNITPKKDNSKAIIKFSIESNCFNGLKIYYKTKNYNYYHDINSLNLYYYKDECLEHCLILPEEARLDEIVIKPYILKRDDGDYMKLKSLIIKELND